MRRFRRPPIVGPARVATGLCLLAACGSDTIEVDLTDVDLCPSCPEGPAGGPVESPPGVWVVGAVFTGDGEPLTDVKARVSVWADSAMEDRSIATAPVDSTAGDFGFRMDVEEICQAPTYAGVSIFDERWDSVLAYSELQRLVAAGVPDGCPFPSAEDVNGVPVDTVAADDITLPPSW